MVEIVRGFEKSPDTLGIPDREDWMVRIDDLNSSASEARRYGKMRRERGIMGKAKAT